MAASPKYKVFDEDGKYQAACKEIEAAAALMGFYGDGATIRTDHGKWAIVWTEGNEAQSAHESYDYVAEIARDREFQRNCKRLRDAGMGHLIDGEVSQ